MDANAENVEDKAEVVEANAAVVARECALDMSESVKKDRSEGWV